MRGMRGSEGAYITLKIQRVSSGAIAPQRSSVPSHQELDVVPLNDPTRKAAWLLALQEAVQWVCMCPIDINFVLHGHAKTVLYE